MERFINNSLGNPNFVFQPVFPNENASDLEYAKTIFETIRCESISFEKAMFAALEELGCVFKDVDFDDSNDSLLLSVWKEFLKLKIPGLDDNFLYEYDHFFKFPYEWVSLSQSFNKKEKVDLLKSLIVVALGKAIGFKEMVDHMVLGYISDKEFYIYTKPDLPYYLAKPEDTGAEYCIIVHDDFYSVKRIDGENILLNLEWIHPLADMETLLAPLDIDKIDIPEKYEVLLNHSFGEMEVVDCKEIRVASFSDAVRIIQNLML